MSIGHPIPEIRLFQNLTLKIQGQGHGWSQSWKSQSVCNILSTHIPFVPCQSALPFLWQSIFKIWPWKSKVKFTGHVDIESHNMGPPLYRLTSILIPCQSAIPFLRYEIQGQGHGWGERWKSQSGRNILSTHIPFVPYQSAFPFLRYSIWPWKSQVKVNWPWCCTTTGLRYSLELQMA